MMIQWAAQDYDSLNWFIILRVSFDTSNFVRDLKLFFMMIQWAAQDYDSLNWFIILRVSFDTSNFVRDLKLTFFTILGFIYTH